MKKQRKVILYVFLTSFICGTVLTGCASATQTSEQQVQTQNFAEANPEFMEVFTRFSDEVTSDNAQLSDEDKTLISIVSLVTQGSGELLKQEIASALSESISPEQIQEAVYHCAPYVGSAKAAEGAAVMQEVFKEQNISLPLNTQGTVTEDTRFEEGLDAQAAIFGEVMRELAAAGPDQMVRSSRYLVENCFGDYYTRGALDLDTRELLTMCILVNLGTEGQLQSHIMGNTAMGKSREEIEQAIYQCLPYAGYPRLLNALSVLNETIPAEETVEADTDIGTDTIVEPQHLFDKGEANPFADVFTGQTYLSFIVPNEEVFNSPSISNVTFEPCARTDWHSHDGGQILLVTEGRGYYQEEGKEPMVMLPGDVIMAEPGVKHWHGAAEGGWFAHLAMSTNPENSGVNWMEPVDDSVYQYAVEHAE